jgi:hypothetical protein
MYGLKPVPFTLKPVPFMMKFVPFKPVCADGEDALEAGP